jgi:esterase/lipase
MNTRLQNIFSTIFFIYILFGFFLYFNQTNLLFYPNSQTFQKCENLDYTEKLSHNQTRFYFHKDQTNTIDLIIYYHGNAGSACDRFEIANKFKQNNLSFIIVEYTGYSADKNNKITQNNLEQNIKDIIEFTKTKNYTNIILGGASLGSGFVSKHVNQTPNNINKIFLISPFDTLSNLAQSKYKLYPANLLLKFKFNNIENLKNYRNEIIIFHGENDKLIPHKFSKNLFKNLQTENKKYELIENTEHNNLHSNNFYKEIITFINDK